LTGLSWRATQSEADEAAVSLRIYPAPLAARGAGTMQWQALVRRWINWAEVDDLMRVLARRATAGRQGRAAADAGPRRSAAEPP